MLLSFLSFPSMAPSLSRQATSYLLDTSSREIRCFEAFFEPRRPQEAVPRNPNGTRTEPERNPNSRDGSLAGGGFCSWKPWEEHGKTDHPANMQLTCKVISSALVCVAFNPFRTLELPMNSMGYCYEQLTICSLGGWRIEWSSLIGVQ